MAVIIIIILLFSSCTEQNESVVEQIKESPTIANVIVAQEEVMQELSEKIHVNQVGYLTKGKKIFWTTENSGKFEIIDSNSNTSVFQGEITMIDIDEAIGEASGYGDFSQLEKEGEYYVLLDGKVKSFDFSISENIYSNLSDSLLKMLYLQRCGIDLEEQYAGNYKHEACHVTMGMIWDTNFAIDGTGGWHDAGDYGKYTVPCVRTVSDLLFSFQLYPDAYTDSINIPESGNGIPDVLDEARVGLEWLMKMQDEDGGVYHKYTSGNFCGMVMPENDYLNQYAISVSPTATASFSAIMAKAYVTYKEIDAEFSNTCLEASLLSYDFLKKNPNLPQFENPEGITTGDYRDSNDKDEKYWAALELYIATCEESYLADAQALYTKHTALFWSDTLELYDVGFLGTFSYLYSENADKDSEFYKKLYADTVETSEYLVELSQNKAFGVAMDKEDYIWGSNMVLTNRANALLMTYELNKNPKYLETAQAHLDYLMGTNALSQCYVTGFGQKSIRFPHHRPSVADKIKEPMPGMVSGGPNASLQDNIAQSNFDENTPPALCFSDESASYSMNEVTTYWNSSALFCAVGLISNK